MFSTEFCYAIALRYILSNILEHALDCKKSGLVFQRHNVIRDALGNIALWLTGSNKGANSERT